MSDLDKILLTAAATVFTGAIVFVFGQLISRFFIEPWYQQRMVIGKITESLLGYMHLFTTPAAKKMNQEAYDVGSHLRSLVAELMARTMAIPFYSWLAWLKLALKFFLIREVCGDLSRLSRIISSGAPNQKIDLAHKIAVSLRINGRMPPGILGWPPGKVACRTKRRKSHA